MANNTNLNTNSVPIPPASGGTGVANTGTITVGGNTSFSGAFTFAGTVTGNTSITFPTSGTLATTSGASGIVNSGTANQLGYYAGSGTTISGLTSGNNSVLVTDGSGVPSISGTLPFTVPVTTGGTGVATMTTAYAPVISGTTATGALQVASTGLATSGFVLTSNGSSAVPSFQAIPTPTVSFLTVAVPLTSNDIKTMYTTPIELIAAPGAGNMIMIYSCFMDFTYSTAAYTGGGTVKVQYGTTFGGGGASTLSTITAGTMGITSNYIMYMVPAGANSLRTDFINKSICISNLTAVFATGSGTAVMNIVYRIITP